MQKVVVVGGGPVGALSALYAARRGYETELYELRDDPNHGDPSLRPDFAVIPLALSERGIQAIAGAKVPGLLDAILTGSRPLYHRMIHTRDRTGKHVEIPMKCGPQGQCLHTLQREKITKYCLLALEKEPTAKLFFNQKMSSCNFENNIVTFESVVWKEKSRISEQEIADDVVGRKPAPVAKPAEELGKMPFVPTNTSETKIVKFDFLIGADGTYSSVRQSMMRKVEVDFSQFYCNALWCDLVFPADEHGNYPLNSRCLHVWPADENIVMAQPDFNGSFRAGMVCSTDRIRHLEVHPEQFADFFAHEFPGIVPDLISPEEATAQFQKHQKIPLKSIKVNKLGYQDKVLLVGDSSHAMAPFHAMGMITGLEDVRIFFEQFRDPAAAQARSQQQQPFQSADLKSLPPFCPPGTIAAYTAHRVPDVHDMIDFAHGHYHELRYGVRSSVARARKIFDAFLARWMPALGWTTLYARIQFDNERFSDVRKKEERQNAIIRGLLVGAAVLVAGGGALGMAGLGSVLRFTLNVMRHQNSIRC